MHSVRVSSLLLVSVIFIAVPTNSKFNYTFPARMQSYSYTCTIESMLFFLYGQDNSMAIIWWLDYIKCNLLINLCISLVITNCK